MSSYGDLVEVICRRLLVCVFSIYFSFGFVVGFKRWYVVGSAGRGWAFFYDVEKCVVFEELAVDLESLLVGIGAV